MRFLSVADRELRSAARQKSTYRTRWVTAAMFFLLLVWLLWVMLGGLSNTGRARDLFKVFSVMTFIYCLALSAGATADAISSERREGTLGLLFLTNLNSAEIMAGKFCSTALSSVYGLLAIFPMLALPMMMGGVTFGQFGRTVLALLLGILSALAWGFVASVLSKRHFSAVARALGLTILFSAGLMLAAAAANAYTSTRQLASWLAIFSPCYTLLAADTASMTGTNHFWLSALAVSGLALAVLGLTTFLLARTWRDRPQAVRLWQRFRPRPHAERPPSPRRTALRRRLLQINPFFWLAARQQVSAPLMMVLGLLICLLTVYVSAPYFGRVVMPGSWYAPVFAQLFAWLWSGLALHALVLYYAAAIASQRLAEDKQTGALELLLSTPTTERTISRGLWLAFARKMTFPALLVFLVHCLFIWSVLVMMVCDPPQQLPPGTTPGELLWCALFDHPLRGRMLNWVIGFILRLPILALVLLVLTWPTLGWVGRWLGLRMKHPGFAPLASLALLITPPVLLFTLFCYVMDRLHLTGGSGREFLPIAQWVAFTMGCGHCVLLSVWAATRLRRHLRPVAMSRYQPLPSWRWRLPSFRALWRFTLATGATAAAVFVLCASYYGLQNWHNQRNWRGFQRTLQQHGESLSLSSRLPAPVPAEANFARSPAFLALLTPTNRETPNPLQHLGTFEDTPTGAAADSALTSWSRQARAPLTPYLKRGRQSAGSKANNRRKEDATALLADWEAQGGNLLAVAEAAARLSAFQTTTNVDAGVVFSPDRAPILLLERLQLLLTVRACAGLALGQNTNAAEDVLTELRLTHLARQFPDNRSADRVNRMLTRSLQPVWEGLGQHAWSEPQLAALQQALSGFDLLADYSNAVHRAVLAHLEVWRAMAERPRGRPGPPMPAGVYAPNANWRLRSRTGWYDCCLQLYEAGRSADEQLDLAADCVRPSNGWIDLSDLPLDGYTQTLIQQLNSAGPQQPPLAFVQTSVNQAVIACALERYRVANGVYPQTIDPLLPAFLACVPRDAMSGRPVIYQCLGTNSFILRGVGPNRIDDRNNAASDDWLWTSSPSKPAAKKK